MRILLRLEFDGTAYSGWQIQPGVRTVQGVLEQALRALCGRTVRVTGAGRTDAGVHSLDMPVHLDVAAGELARIEKGLNAKLPPDVSCRSVTTVGKDFHARYDAVSRSYLYRIGKTRHPLRRITEYQPGTPRLNTDRMRVAAGLSTGLNSWRGFAKEGGGNATWDMNVAEATVLEDPDGWSFRITANRFLRGVVRIWSGTLFRIGAGGLEPGVISEILMTEEREKAGPSLPACGLTLVEVTYPNGDG